MNFIKHFKTITIHKLIVMKYCFKVGLYKQGLLHDLSKYSLVEFIAGIKYYQGNVSPNGIQKKVEGYSKAWLHHKGRNKHHFEYWIDYGQKLEDGFVGVEMPKKYVVEMFIDRMAASKNYEKEKYSDRSPLEYYNVGKDYYIINEKTRTLLEKLLVMLCEKGEKETLNYIKKKILNEK
ncbi:MAG: catalase [Clostridiales bacterium]|nr:catalase [Clostridiales bacterium]